MNCVVLNEALDKTVVSILFMLLPIVLCDCGECLSQLGLKCGYNKSLNASTKIIYGYFRQGELYRGKGTFCLCGQTSALAVMANFSSSVRLLNFLLLHKQVTENVKSVNVTRGRGSRMAKSKETRLG